MEKLLSSLSVGFVLRSFFAGVFSLISYRIAISGMENLHAALKVEPNTLGLALIAGVTIYSIHRSVLYPVIEWFFNTREFTLFRRRRPLVSDSTLQDLTSRWDRASDPKSPSSGRVQHTCSWADFAHMQYVSTLCIAFGAAVANLDPSLKTKPCIPVIVAATVLGISAIISDWRLRSVEDYLLKIPPFNQSVQPTPGSVTPRAIE